MLNVLPVQLEAIFGEEIVLPTIHALELSHYHTSSPVAVLVPAQPIQLSIFSESVTVMLVSFPMRESVGLHVLQHLLPIQLELVM